MTHSGSVHQDPATALDEISALAARPFASRDEGIAAVLELIYRTLGLRTPFVARTEGGDFEVVAVSDHEGCPGSPGDTLPLTDTY